MARFITVVMACALLGACGLEDELKGEPCDVDDDCWHTQHCARTAVESSAALPGVCQPKDVECVKGGQLGCACIPADPSLSCFMPAVDFLVEYPDMDCDPTQMVCVLADMDGTSEG
jgi:hypothetical protein